MLPFDIPEKQLVAVVEDKVESWCAFSRTRPRVVSPVMLRCNLNSLRRISLPSFFFFKITPSSCRAHQFSSTAKQTPLRGLAAIPRRSGRRRGSHQWDGQQPTTYTTSRPAVSVPLHVPISSVDRDVYAPQFCCGCLLTRFALCLYESIACLKPHREPASCIAPASF